MYDGTLRSCWQAIAVFPHLIVLADEDGIIDLTADALHARTGIPLEIIQVALSFLEAEDSKTRTLGCGGRRLERMDSHRPWGWRIVNYEKYRLMANREDKKKADRERIARKRAADKAKQDNGVANCRNVSKPVADVADTDTDTDTDTEREKQTELLTLPSDFKLTPELEIRARELEITVDLHHETEKFKVHHQSKGTVSQDWDAEWIMWVLHTLDYKGPTSTTPVDSGDMSQKDLIYFAKLFGLEQDEDESDKEFKAKVMEQNDRRIAQEKKALSDGSELGS